MSDSELISVFDQSGVRLGVKTRAEAHQHHDWHQLVFVMSVHLDPHYEPVGLFQLRSLPGDPFHGQIDLLAAGHVLAEESTEQAAIRECAEEAGVELAIDDLTFLKRCFLSLDFGICRNIIEYFYLSTRPLTLNELIFSQEAQTFVQLKLCDFADLLDGRQSEIPALLRTAQAPEQVVEGKLDRECLAIYAPEIIDNFRYCVRAGRELLTNRNC